MTASEEPLLLNCGSEETVFSEDNDWLPDDFYLSGRSFSIKPEEAAALQPHAVSLRAFARDEVSCYRVPAPAGKYRVRLGFAYNNYDGLRAPPAFSVYVEGVLVATLDFGTEQSALQGRALYKDYVTDVLDGFADTCFRALRGNATFVNSVEFYYLDERLYSVPGAGAGAVSLANFARINCGGLPITSNSDQGFRSWAADAAPAAAHYKQLVLPPGRRLQGAGRAPDFLPPAMLATAREAGSSGFTGFAWELTPVVRGNKWLVLLYFAELDPRVRPGERVFSVSVNDATVARFDVLAAAGGRPFSPISYAVVVNQTLATAYRRASVAVRLQRAVGSKYNPIISGVAVYELIPTSAARESVAAEVAGKVYIAPRRRRAALSDGELAAILLGSVGGTVLIGAVVLLSVLWRRHVASLDDDLDGGTGAAEGDERSDAEVLVHSGRRRSEQPYGPPLGAVEGMGRGGERAGEDLRIFTRYREV